MRPFAAWRRQASRPIWTGKRQLKLDRLCCVTVLSHTLYGTCSTRRPTTAALVLLRVHYGVILALLPVFPDHGSFLRHCGCGEDHWIRKSLLIFLWKRVSLTAGIVDVRNGFCCREEYRKIVPTKYRVIRSSSACSAQSRSMSPDDAYTLCLRV